MEDMKWNLVDFFVVCWFWKLLIYQVASFGLCSVTKLHLNLSCWKCWNPLDEQILILSSEFHFDQDLTERSWLLFEWLRWRLEGVLKRSCSLTDRILNPTLDGIQLYLLWTQCAPPPSKEGLRLDGFYIYINICFYSERESNTLNWRIENVWKQLRPMFLDLKELLII